jgi:hypothetical protein
MKELDNMIKKGCIQRWKKKRRRRGENRRRRGRNEAGAELQLSPAMSQAPRQSRSSTLLNLLLSKDYSISDVQQIHLSFGVFWFSKLGEKRYLRLPKCNIRRYRQTSPNMHMHTLSICIDVQQKSVVLSISPLIRCGLVG